MLTIESGIVHYQAEIALLRQAAAGDIRSAHTVLQYLCSANVHLRSVMVAALHECSDATVWKALLRCLGEHCWQMGLRDELMQDPDAIQRLDETLIEAFNDPHSPAEMALKAAVLHDCLEDESVHVRQMAAYLLGAHGGSEALPILAEMLRGGEVVWQRRAVKALLGLNQPACGPLLIEALGIRQGGVHQAAGRAIQKVCRTIQLALVEGLSHPDEHIRWHVARALLACGDLRGLEMVAEGLYHADLSIRWASAEALGAAGEPSIPVLLRMLWRPDLNQQVIQAIHHAFHSFKAPAIQDRLQPLLKVLQYPSNITMIPVTAKQLLDGWSSPGASPGHGLTTNSLFKDE